MKMYQLLWRRILGLSCLFLLGLFMITLNGVPRKVELVMEPNPRTEPSMTLSKTSISNAISYVGGKLRLLVAYSPNDELSKDSKNDYNDDFDIIGDNDEGSYPNDLDSNDDDDIDNPNKTFRVGDFDYENDNDVTVVNNTAKKNVTTTLNAVKTTSVYRNKLLVNLVNVTKNLIVVRDGVYWSSELEQQFPKGMTDSEVISFLGATKKGKVSRVEPPTWNRCGRPQNQFVVFQDGTRACARYRSPHHYLVQGEVMSFYLSRLLGINNVPTVTLSSIDAGRQWKDPNVVEALRTGGWKRNATVALIQWVDGLERDRMPALILKALKEGKTIQPMSDELRQMNTNQLVELMQWSDLILFDYITGNYDRVASMQDAADRERKPSILSETIHNLVKSRKTRTIWLIDNEGGLLDAYSLLYGPPNVGADAPVSTTTTDNNPSANRFVRFHRAMLRTMCVFRRSTVHRISWLSHKTRPVRVLLDYLLKREPHFRRLPDVTRYKHFVNNFKKRLTEVRLHVERCQKHAASGIVS